MAKFIYPEVSQYNINNFNLTEYDVDLIEEFGSEIKGYLVITNKDTKNAISFFKKRIERIEKIKNRKIKIVDRKLVSVCKLRIH